jgi:hypothetical protein
MKYNPIKNLKGFAHPKGAKKPKGPGTMPKAGKIAKIAKSMKSTKLTKGY